MALQELVYHVLPAREYYGLQSSQEIFALLNSRHACEQVKNGKELTAMVLRLCKDKGLATEMGQNCLDIIRENRGATQRNTQELRQLFEKHHIVP